MSAEVAQDATLQYSAEEDHGKFGYGKQNHEAEQIAAAACAC